MLEWFIAAIAVLLMVNGFMAVVLRRIAVRVKRQTEAIVVGRLGIYDELVADKSAVLRAQQEQIAMNGELLAKKEPVVETERSEKREPIAFSRTPEYVADGLAEKYSSIKRGFCVDKRALAKRYAASAQAGESHALYAAASKKLTLDAVYELNCLSSDAQQKAAESLLGDGAELLTAEFLERERAFSAPAFARFVRERERELSPTVYVYTGDSDDDFSDAGDNIVTVFDGDICEGAQIRVGSEIYDYSIRKREMSL